MRTPYRLGRLFGLEILVRRTTIPASGSLWVILSLVAHFFLELDWPAAVFTGLAGVLLHYFAALCHQLGHAAAARRTGFPMRGLMAYGFLSMSLYPPDEPALPTEVHIRRAVGGPPASFLVALLAGLAAWAVPAGETGALLLWFLCLDSLLIFCIGALLPIGFTDGATLLQQRGKG